MTRGWVALWIGRLLVLGTFFLVVYLVFRTFGGPRDEMRPPPSCSDYSSQASAQAAYRAHPDLLRRLDQDLDGLACERNPMPYDDLKVTP